MWITLHYICFFCIKQNGAHRPWLSYVALVRKGGGGGWEEEEEKKRRPLLLTKEKQLTVPVRQVGLATILTKILLNSSVN